MVRWRKDSRWRNVLNPNCKNKDGHNFQFTKFSWIDLVPTDREVFQVHSLNWPVANLPVVVFSFSATRNAITKGNKYLTFGFSFVEGELFVSSWLAISNTGKNFLSYKLWCHTTISSPENSHNNTVKKYCIFSHAFTIVNPRLFVWIFLDHGC